MQAVVQAGHVRSQRACPRCRSTVVARSRTRNPLERWMKHLGLYTYRCQDCWHRFLQLRAGKKRVGTQVMMG